MIRAGMPPVIREPAAWAVALAFALLYLSWGTTYYAIRVGVHNQQLPPALFGGVRVGLAGIIVLAFLRLRGDSLRLPARDLVWLLLSGISLFTLGNGLMTAAMDSLPSGVAAVVGATTPLWMALMEALVPRGDRLSARGWLGLFIGLGGVLLLIAGQQGHSSVAAGLPAPDDETGQFGANTGLILIIASSLSWALGSLLLRYRRPAGSHLAGAGYQMALGGTGLALIGLTLGEAEQLTADRLTAGAFATFLYLLVVGSLVGFVSFNWLLGHVSAARVGTYAYVNPLVAVLVGWLVGNERFTAWIAGGVVVILTGVALVRSAVRSGPQQKTLSGRDESAPDERRRLEPVPPPSPLTGKHSCGCG